MYESRFKKPLTRRHFFRRMMIHLLVSIILIFLSLIVGMVGYHHYEHLTWIDGFLNSAMLLGGMGPVNSPQSDGGKIFAGLYALYAGLLFILTAGLIVAPALHRMLHLFHWENENVTS